MKSDTTIKQLESLLNKGKFDNISFENYLRNEEEIKNSAMKELFNDETIIKTLKKLPND